MGTAGGGATGGTGGEVVEGEVEATVGAAGVTGDTEAVVAGAGDVVVETLEGVGRAGW